MNRPESENRDLFAIADFAREFGISTRAIRFYESKGLLAPERVGATRIFRRRDRARLMLILRGKRLGLALAEIREILDLYDSREGDRRQLARFIEALEHRRRQLEVQRGDIDALLDEIGAIERDCRRRLREAGPERPVAPRAAAAASRVRGAGD